ncbi:MAG: ATP-binding protein [Bacteroidales bacterium]|nr:ATP-binding protein [Bacteroidales bacterium]
MKINSIQIKNIRGLADKTIILDMIPNKPSVLVAPNGSGKSSFALAFERLNKNRIKLEDGDYYQNIENNKPEIRLKVDDVEYLANERRNDIASQFACFVINSKNKPKTIQRNIEGRNVPTSKMTVAPIVLAKIVPNMDFTYDFKEDKQLTGFQRGVIVKINHLLGNKSFLYDLDLVNLNQKHKLQAIETFINNVRSYIGTGSKDHIYKSITDNDIAPLNRATPCVQKIVGKLRNLECYANMPEARLYLDAIQLILVYNNDKDAFTNRIKRSRYLDLKERYVTLFASLKDTWKNIRPKEVDGNLIIEIDNSEQLSNGERDIIVFLAMLEKAKMKLNKDNNILIIDEVFDYLDDANFISAQYYISKYIEEFKEENKRIRRYNTAIPAEQSPKAEKNFFPVILTHLDPVTFKQFGYKDLKVYYFDDYTSAQVSENMKKLIRLRDTLEKNDKSNNTTTDLVSSHLLHYHNTPVDLSATLTDQCFTRWRNVQNFKEDCKTEAEKYITNVTPFDPIAVCVWLRECIEKYVFNMLNTNQQQFFLQEHGTKKKLQFAAENGVDYPEVFSLLGLIYNNPLHLGSDGETKSDTTLASRLKNNTIKAMIKSVMETN